MNMIVSPWTSELMLSQGRYLGESANEELAPTTIHLADGTTYEIPTGPKGSAAWARQASLIATAYKQGGDYENAYKWTREYTLRNAAYNRIQEGEDIAAILAGRTWLEALRDIFIVAKKEVDDWKMLLALGLVVVGVGFFKGSLQAGKNW